MAEPIVVKFEADITELKNRLKELENANKKVGESGKKAGKETEDAFNKTSKGLEGTLANIKAVGEGILAALSVEALTRFAINATKAYAEVEKGELRLLAALKGNTAQFKRLTDQAEKLQKAYGVDADTIKAQQAFLAIQGRTERQIESTVDAAHRLSEVLGIDIQSAVRQLDATMEGNVGRLGKLDAAFSSLTKEELANGKAIDIVNEKYKNFADATLQSTDVTLKKMKVFFEDVIEDIGSGFAAMLKTVGVGAGLISDIFKKIFGIKDEAKQAGVDDGEAYFQGVEQSIQQAGRQDFEKVAQQLIDQAGAGLRKIQEDQAEAQKVADRVRAKGNEASAKGIEDGIKAANKKQILLEEQRIARVTEIINAERDKKKVIFDEQAKDASDAAAKALEAQRQALEKQAKAEQEFRDKQLAALDSRLKDYITHLIEGLNQQNLTEKGYSVERIKIDLVELEERKKLYESYGKDVSDINRQIAESKRKLNEALEKPIDIHPNREDFEKIQKEQEEANKGILARHRQLVQDILVASGSLIQSLFDISANNRDARFTFISDQNDAILEGLDQEADALEEANKRKALSDRAYEVQKAELLKRRKAQEEDFAKQQKRIAREDAIARKTAAIFAIILNTAQGITSALAQLPPNIPLSILVGITGAAQLAVASSTPIPRLKDGTDYVELGKNKKGVDTIPALLNEGERVTKAEINKKYWNVLNSIDGGRFDEFVHKNYVLPAMIQFKKQSEANQRAELGQHIAKGIIFNTSSEDFGKAISKGVSIKNEKSLAKQIARELSDILPKERHHW